MCQLFKVSILGWVKTIIYSPVGLVQARLKTSGSQQGTFYLSGDVWQCQCLAVTLGGEDDTLLSTSILHDTQEAPAHISKNYQA